MEIKLTQGKVAIVDDGDFWNLSQYSWCAHKNYYEGWMAIRGERGKTIYMHRQIACPPDGFEVDHIDHNTLNNSRSNLRVVTRQQNCLNRGVRSDNVTGLKGVSLVKSSGKYRARIVIDGYRLTIGYYNTPEEAAESYKEFANKHHGEYSKGYWRF